jgi:hypothetical protein
MLCKTGLMSPLLRVCIRPRGPSLLEIHIKDIEAGIGNYELVGRIREVPSSDSEAAFVALRGDKGRRWRVKNSGFLVADQMYAFTVVALAGLEELTSAVHKYTGPQRTQLRS